MNAEYDYKKGTTTVGIVTNEGLVLAADKRATMGYYIANKEVEKILPIDDRISITTAGSVGDAQTLVRYLRAELQLFKTRNDRELTVNGAATFLANILQNYKFFPFYVQILVGGVNPDGTVELYNIDAIGGMTKEKFTATGSGSPIAMGVLETSYHAGMSLTEAASAAIKAIQTAIRRDAGTGEGVDLVIITAEGTKRYTAEEIHALTKG